MVQKNQESRRKNWTTGSSTRSFAPTAHSFTCSILLASLSCSAALIHSLTCSLPSSWEPNQVVLNHSAKVDIDQKTHQSRSGSSLHKFARIKEVFDFKRTLGGGEKKREKEMVIDCASSHEQRSGGSGDVWLRAPMRGGVGHSAGARDTIRCRNGVGIGNGNCLAKRSMLILLKVVILTAMTVVMPIDCGNGDW